MNIDLGQLQVLKTRSADINQNIASEFDTMKKTLNEICDNVKSSNLTAGTKNLTDAITEIADSLNTIMPNVIAFLDTQIKSYSDTNTQIKSELDSLISTIGENFQ